MNDVESARQPRSTLDEGDEETVNDVIKLHFLLILLLYNFLQN